MNEQRRENASLKNQLPEYGDLESERLKFSLSSMLSQRMAWLEEAVDISTVRTISASTNWVHDEGKLGSL